MILYLINQQLIVKLLLQNLEIPLIVVKYHFKRITLEEHDPNIIFDESKIIDEYKND